jgi:tRNA(adenine34) deaminase
MAAQHPDSAFMARAIEVAEEGGAAGDYRIGALIVGSGGIIAHAHTDLSDTKDPTAHAEILAIRRAAARRDSRYLQDCYLYTTLEPCSMCASAAIWAKMAGLVFGASLEDALERGGEWKNGKFYSWRQIRIKARSVAEQGTPRLDIHEEFMRSACLDLLPSPSNVLAKDDPR